MPSPSALHETWKFHHEYHKLVIIWEVLSSLSEDVYNAVFCLLMNFKLQKYKLSHKFEVPSTTAWTQVHNCLVPSPSLIFIKLGIPSSTTITSLYHLKNMSSYQGCVLSVFVFSQTWSHKYRLSPGKLSSSQLSCSHKKYHENNCLNTSTQLLSAKS